MKISLIGFMAFGFLCSSSAYAKCDCPTANSVPVPQPQVVTQPAPTVRQQHVVMVPQTQTVDVEQTITEYVPQTRTETVQQEIQVMVPEVREYVQEQVQSHSHGYHWAWQYYQHHHQQVPDVGQGAERDHASLALYYARLHVRDMEIGGARGGDLRRARRSVAHAALRLKRAGRAL